MESLKAHQVKSRILPFLICIILLALSTATVVLESRVLGAEPGVEIQYPGSNIAEWMFIPLVPVLLDAGPMIATLGVGCAGLLAAVVGGVWMIVQLCKISKWKKKVWGYTTCLITSICTVAGLGIMTYVFISEGNNKLPPLFDDWSDTVFTREYYVCTAIPSLLADTNALYGFAVCDHAQAARCIMVSVTVVSLALTILCVVQTYNTQRVPLPDPGKFNVEKERGRTSAPRPLGPAIPARGSSYGGTLGTRPPATSEPVVKKPEPVLSDGLLMYGGYYTKLSKEMK